MNLKQIMKMSIEQAREKLNLIADRIYNKIKRKKKHDER